MKSLLLFLIVPLYFQFSASPCLAVEESILANDACLDIKVTYERTTIDCIAAKEAGRQACFATGVKCGTTKACEDQQTQCIAQITTFSASCVTSAQTRALEQCKDAIRKASPNVTPTLSYSPPAGAPKPLMGPYVHWQDRPWGDLIKRCPAIADQLKKNKDTCPKDSSGVACKYRFDDKAFTDCDKQFFGTDTCKTDTKTCADKSVVHRVPPSCDFEKCPDLSGSPGGGIQ